ncbi:hypothetical protein H7F15_05700 [Pontibacter sp. Tf4]|uniref:hypothetical protein n=1 Tax=Pontibacter sp. Tf4 TaxID=2761620 RepID=UPI001627CCD7|nr:hypothetical protein [Pontibacter sp. Tf4]MBB6610522.1 hypothetical protein [Pontibacter sp. Tf4]
MIKTLKYQLLTGWHLARWIRLVLGVALLIQAIAKSDVLVGAFAILLLGQVVTNTGCCGPSGCSVPQPKQHTKDTTGPIE